MDITREWLKKYEEVKDLLVSPVNFSEIFEKNEIDGKNYYC